MQGIIMEDENLIDLQNAHVTQLTEGNIKGDWMVRQNVTSDDLFTLPPHLSEKDVFTILKFARKFELIAFNTGIHFQKSHQDARLTERVANLEEELQQITEHSDKLAGTVERLTTQGDN